MCLKGGLPGVKKNGYNFIVPEEQEATQIDYENEMGRRRQRSADV